MNPNEAHYYKMLKKYTRSKYTPTTVHTALLIRPKLLDYINNMSYVTPAMRVHMINQMRNTLISNSENY